MAIILVLVCRQRTSSVVMTTIPDAPTPHQRLRAGTSECVKFLCSTPALLDDTQPSFARCH